MTKIRGDRITTTEVDKRVSAVAHAQVVDRERMAKLERENARLREQVAKLTAANGPELPHGSRVDTRGDVFDATGKHIGIVLDGNFVRGFPEHCTVAPDGVVRQHPFNEAVGRLVDGQFVSNEAEIAAAREQAGEAERQRKQRIRDENRAHQEKMQGVWTDPFGITRIGADGQEYKGGAAEN